MRKRILYTNHLPLGSASSYRQAALAKYLSRLGFGADFLGRRSRSVVTDGSTPLAEEWSHFDNFWYFREPLVSSLRQNLSIYREAIRNADLIHINRANPFTASIASLEMSPARVLVVDMEDWDGFRGYSSYARLYGPRGFLLTFYENAFPRTADLVIAVSHLLYARMNQLGIPKKKLLLVPNGYDEDLFVPSTSPEWAREAYDLGDAPVVMYMSTYWTFEKQLHVTALSAFRKVVEQVPEARLLMVGKGNLRIDELISEMGLQRSVIPTGFVPRDRLPHLMAAADVAMHVISDHPFHSASSPMVMPEYMAMGKAIVAPRVGELSYALGDGSGLLVDRVDADLLAQGVVRLLRDEGLRREIAAAGLRRARKEYSYTVLADRLKTAYERLGA